MALGRFVLRGVLRMQKIPWRWAKRFLLRVSLGVPHRKAVSQAFLAQFLKNMEKRAGSPQKRLAPKTARPKACVSHHDQVRCVIMAGLMA